MLSQPRPVSQASAAEDGRRADRVPRATVFTIACRALSHGVDVFRDDLVNDPLLAGLGEGVFVLVQIFLGHLIDMLGGAILRRLADLAANFQEAIGIVGIDERDRDARVALHVLVLQSADSGVHPNFAVLKIDPDGISLRAAVRHKRAQTAKGLLLKEVEKVLGNLSGHDVLLGEILRQSTTGDWIVAAGGRMHSRREWPHTRSRTNRATVPRARLRSLSSRRVVCSLGVVAVEEPEL